MSSEPLTLLSPPGASARAPSPGRLAWLAFWTLSALTAFWLLALDLSRTGPGLSIAGMVFWGRDFVNVWTSGLLVLQDRVEIVYDVEAYRAFQAAWSEGRLFDHNYSYPPVTLLYTWLLALLPYGIAWPLWLAGTGGFFYWAARPYLAREGLPATLALLAPASFMNLWCGHYGFLVGGLWLAAWSRLDRRPWLAGMLIGLMVVKPHLAILAPFVLAWRREWRAMAAAAATVIFLVALSALVFGTEPWRVYLTETVLLQARMVDDVGAFFLRMMPTATPALILAGAGTSLAAWAQALLALGAVAMLLRFLPRDPMECGLATATATFLVLPYAFGYDMTAAGLAGLILFARRRQKGSPLPAILAGAAAFVPMGVLFLNAGPAPVAPLLLAVQLALLLGLRPGARAERAV